MTTAASIWAVAAVGLAVGGGMFLAAVSATLLALALLVLAKPLKAKMFPDRKQARRLRLVVERGTPLAELREEVEASEAPLERIVVRPSSADSAEDEAELVFGKGSRQEELLSLMDGLRGVSGVREVSSASGKRFGGVQAQAVAPGAPIHWSAWKANFYALRMQHPVWFWLSGRGKNRNPGPRHSSQHYVW